MTTKNSNSTATGKIYFVSGNIEGKGSIRVIDADGSNEIILVKGTQVIEPDGVEVDTAAGKMYWTEPDGVEVDTAAGKMYWTDMGPGGAADKSVALNDGRIMRADIDGTNVETVVPLGLTTTPKQLALDVAGGKVYWSDRGDLGDQRVNPKIMRANLDGSSVETIVSTDLMSAVGIALDTANGKVYFTDRYANNIKRANLDGSDVEVVVRDTEYPVDLAFDFEKRVFYWTARKSGCASTLRIWIKPGWLVQASARSLKACMRQSVSASTARTGGSSGPT